MHPNFADWYNVASLKSDDEKLKKRWQGVETFSNKADAQSLSEAVRLATGRAPRDSQFSNKLSQIFKEADIQFLMLDNDAELSILSACILLNLISSDMDCHADFASLAIATNDCAGLRQLFPLTQQLRTAARHYICTKAQKIRQAKLSPLAAIANGTQSLKEIRELCKASDLANLAEKLHALLGQLVAHTKESRIAIESLEHMRLTQSEELNVLWWIFGEYHLDMEKRFSENSIEDAIANAALDLAKLTEILPGLVAAKAYLDKVIRIGSPKKLPTTSLAMITKAPNSCRANIDHLEKCGLLDLCPWHAAVQRTSTSTGDSWTQPYHQSFGIDPSKKLSAIDWAFQIYEESLLGRAFDACK